MPFYNTVWFIHVINSLATLPIEGIKSSKNRDIWKKSKIWWRTFFKFLKHPQSDPSFKSTPESASVSASAYEDIFNFTLTAQYQKLLHIYFDRRKVAQVTVTNFLDHIQNLPCSYLSFQVCLIQLLVPIHLLVLKSMLTFTRDTVLP